MGETLKDILIFWNKGTYRGVQRRLADEMGVNEGTISNWLRGRGSPSEQAMVKLASLLRIDLAQVRLFFPKEHGTQEFYDGFKRRGLIKIEGTVGDTGETLHVTVSKELADRFRAICKYEHRDQNNQMELILEQWFAQRERQSDVVPDASGNTTPGPQPFATPRHRRSGEGRPSGRV